MEEVFSDLSLFSMTELTSFVFLILQVTSFEL